MECTAQPQSDEGDWNRSGYATVTQSKGKPRAGVSGRKDMKINAVTLLQRNNGYRHERGPNEAPKRN